MLEGDGFLDVARGWDWLQSCLDPLIEHDLQSCELVLIHLGQVEPGEVLADLSLAARPRLGPGGRGLDHRPGGLGPGPDHGRVLLPPEGLEELGIAQNLRGC